MLKVSAIDAWMTTDLIINFISIKMTLQHLKLAQHQDCGGQQKLI